MAEIQNNFVIKDPDASEWPQGIDWTTYLAKISDTETLASSSWAITGADAVLTQSDDSIVTGSKKTQTKLAAGTSGVTYTLTNSIVTSSGIHDDGSITVLVQDQ